MIDPVKKPLPAKKPIKKTTIDYLIYVAVVIGPLMTIPQIYSIWFEKQGGVSIISWIAYFVVSIIWLVYSLKIKDKPMIIGQDGQQYVEFTPKYQLDGCTAKIYKDGDIRVVIR